MKYYFSRIKIVFTILSLTLLFGAFGIADAQSKPDNPSSPSLQEPVAQVAKPEINFTVSMPKPATHLLEVKMRLRQNNLPKQIELVLPVWTPGSYLIREYARHVLDFTVADSNGNALEWEKISKNTWRVNTKNVNEIIVSYRVYSNELTVRTNELNDQHAFFTPAALLMFPRGQFGAPSTIKVEPFDQWKVATALDPGNEANTFHAENFDILYDSPFEVGNFKEVSFEALGKQHRIVIEGDGNYDLQRISRDVKKIVEIEAAIFNNEVPYKQYAFIVNTRGSGGLEHLNSTALQWNRWDFTGGRYVGFLGLVAHEFFHLWNVKRIRPDALGPFDYERENYTKNLWIAEGGTEYFANIVLRRAGFISDEGYLEERVAGIAELQNRPGRFQQSLEESSFDAWIKYYRPDENSVNREISYYDKGEIVNMLLDLTIRQKTNGAKSLDDVMRALYIEFYGKNKNYSPQDFQKVCESVAGTSLDEFFRKYVRGRDEIDYNAIFTNFGLRLETKIPYARPQPFLGAQFRQQGDFLAVATILAGGPAYEQGLNTNDQILALDGYRIANQNDLNARLADKKPGDKIKLTLFRLDQLRELNITLGGREPEQYRIIPVANPNEKQKQLYQQWLGAELN